jgi:small-conductance mechanosensitive channel
MQAMSKKDAEIKALEAKIADADKKLTEQATVWGAKEADLATQLASAQTSVKTLTTEKGEIETTAQKSAAELVKYEALKEYPQLLPMADVLPTMPDLETMKAHLALVAKGVQEIAGEQAKEITAGVTPGATTPTGGDPVSKYPHTTHGEWMDALNKAAGSNDFESISAEFQRWHDKVE